MNTSQKFLCVKLDKSRGNIVVSRKAVLSKSRDKELANILSKIKEGDYVSLVNVGAYGMSLSSNYNTRPIIAEVMVKGSKDKVIRKRQTLESLVNS